MNESNGNLELDNWIQIGIVHVVNQTQSMFKSYTKVVKFRKDMLDGFNGSMHVNFIEEVLLILMNVESCYSYWCMLQGNLGLVNWSRLGCFD